MRMLFSKMEKMGSNPNFGKEVLRRSPDFELLSPADGSEEHFFIHRSGHKVRTDRLGRIIWENLPGTADEVVAKIREGWNISERLISEFLYILLRAGIVRSSLSEEGGGRSEPRTDGKTRQEDAREFCTGCGEGGGAKSVSVIVITRNGEEHIEGCLRSVFGQSCRNFEVIVVDNGSRDRTARLVRDNFPGAKLHSLKKNIYFPGAVNYGIRQVEGDYFFILNDDTELDTDCVFHLCRRMKSEEKAGAAAPMMKFYHMRGFINGVGNHIRNYGWGSDNFIGCVDIGQFSELKELPSACFGAVFLNRKVVEEVGLLDRRYTAYYEDIDWSFRCWLKGWRIVAAPEARIYHKFGAFWKTMGRKLKFVVRNRLRLVLKLFKGKVRSGFLKSYIKEDVKSCLSLLKRKEFGLVAAYAKAYLSLAVSLPEIFFRRKKAAEKRPGEPAIRDILSKNPEWFSCLDEDNNPVIDVRMIFSYYRWEFNRFDKSG
jgi:GT2 family glycosyltransferase